MLHKRAVLVITLLGIGCGTGDAWSDLKETPLIERGACATVIMPGEQVPLGSQPNCPNGYSSLGGAVVYDEKDYEQRTTPKQLARRAARVPAGVVGAPIAAGAAVAKGSEGGSQASASSSGAEREGVIERDEIERMRREIIERERMGRSQTPPPAPQRASAPQPAGVAPVERAGMGSIADELAALQGARGTETAAPPDVASAPPPGPQAALAASRPTPTAPVADRVADRDGDGAPDHWIYRDASGRPVREEFDENGDARPDRTAWLDPVSGRELRMEEDANLDGRIDTWVEYADGTVLRQRRDANYDGIADNWSYYDRDGKLSRQEQDLDGDGFRNRESLYRAGKLAKQREDRDRDGRFDLVTLYDDEERIARRDEDRDGDGKIDTRSIYQAGKLVKREVVSGPIDDGDDLTQTAW